MKGVFLDWDTLSRDDIDRQPLQAELSDLSCYPMSTRAQTLERIADAEVLLLNKVQVDSAVFAAAPKLKLLCLAATGYNNVDLQAATKAGVAVANIQDYCTASVAQHVFALLLSLNQHLSEYLQAVQQGEWSESSQFCLLNWPIRELAGKTMGIVGYGHLGQAVARLAEAFGMRVLLAERPECESVREGRLCLDELLPQVDVLSLHCPLTPQTQHLIDAAAFQKMRSDAFLINTARGAVVDPQALIGALQSGEIAGAAIDVLAQEPPPADDPILQYQSPRLLLTPHIAWASREARQRAVQAMAMNIRAYKAGSLRSLTD